MGGLPSLLLTACPMLLVCSVVAQATHALSSRERPLKPAAALLRPLQRPLLVFFPPGLRALIRVPERSLLTRCTVGIVPVGVDAFFPPHGSLRKGSFSVLASPSFARRSCC